MSTTDHGHGPAHGGQGHEEDRVSVSGIVWFVVILTVVCVVSFVLMGALYVFFESRAVSTDPAPPALGMRAREAPPEPRLQTQPVADYKAFRAAEEAKLHSYGWMDKDKKVVRIPVERAMELIVERGLPPTGPSAEAPTAPAPMP